MTTHCRVVGASTSFRNTPESDRQRQVLHDVGVVLADGSEVTVRIMAEEPGAAIDRVKSMTDEAVTALPRVPAA